LAVVRYLISIAFVVIAYALCRRFARPLMTSKGSSLTTMAVVSIAWDAVKIGVPISDAFIVLAALALAGRLVRGQLRVRLPAPCLVGAGLIGFCILITAVVPVAQQYAATRYLISNGVAQTLSARRILDIAQGAKFELSMLVIPVLVITATRNKADIARLADLWVISAVVSALVAISDAAHLTHIYLTLLIGSVQGVDLGSNRGGGLTNHADHLATVAVMTLPVAVTWLARNRAWRIGGIGGIGVLLLGIYASGSRAGLVSGLLSLSLGLVFVERTRRLLIAALPSVVLLLLAAIAFDSHFIDSVLGHTRISSLSGSYSNIARQSLAAQAIDDFHYRPLTGIGFDVSTQAHSIYLQVLAAGGILSTVGFVAYIGGVASTVRLWVGGRYDALSGALAIATVSWLFNGTVGNDLVDRYPYIPIALLLAVWHHRSQQHTRWPSELATGRYIPAATTRVDHRHDLVAGGLIRR